MNMSDDILKAFNDQITLELTADMTYRQLAIEADAQNLSGMAAWLRHQADEEIVHANKFIDHTLDRGSHPRIGTIEAPEVEAGLSALEIFQAALAHEEKVLRLFASSTVPAPQLVISTRFRCCSGSSMSRSRKRRLLTKSSVALNSLGTTARGCSVSTLSLVPATWSPPKTKGDVRPLSGNDMRGLRHDRCAVVARVTNGNPVPITAANMR